MLYITTRSDKDAFTAARTWKLDYAADGGLFVPFQLPHFDIEEITELKNKAFGQTVADIMNLFFSARMNSWDVDFMIGRNPVKVISMNHRLAVAEIWHNSEGLYSFAEKELYKKIAGNDAAGRDVSEWVRIAVRIAFIFGVFGEMMRQDLVDPGQLVDVSVPSIDFTAPAAALYARKMGLPIGSIICTCEEDSPVWDIIRRCEVSTSGKKMPEGVERLLQAQLGCNESRRYIEICEKKGIYAVDEALFGKLNCGMSAAVVGNQRISAVIRSMYRTNSYVIDPDTAFVYGGLQDYRAGVGESRSALIFAEKNPDFSMDNISTAIGISSNEFTRD